MPANIFQMEYQNPHASMPMQIPVLVLPNTPEEVADENIRRNSALPLEWLYVAQPHERLAIMCGSGPSLEDHVWAIRELRMASGADVFAVNAASAFLAPTTIDYQVIVDAKEETAELVDQRARHHLISSQVHPRTIKAANNPTLFHLANVGIEDLMPPERVEAGGYTLVGGGVCGGITAMVVAYILGYRTFHFFGYDSCHRDDKSHVVPQSMNELIPGIDVEWGEKTYHASMPMKIQAEAFPKFARLMEKEGCKIHVHGDGLLPAMWKEPPATEKQKYQLMWADKEYRAISFGEALVKTFMEVAKPEGVVIDFGCGTGRAGREMLKRGLNPLLVDFTDNCRDDDCLNMPFFQHDLTEPLLLSAPFGLCCDVMEHIPTDDVVTVITNIMRSAETVFFSISRGADKFGKRIGQKLHMTVRHHSWWADVFHGLGFTISWEQENKRASCFLITQPLRQEN